MSARRRTPVVLQMALADCGAACLAMVASARSQRATLRDVRRQLEIGRDGVSARALLAAAGTFGLRGKAIAAPADRVGELALPAIAAWNGDHFVVIDAVGRGRVTVIDPARGRIRLAADEFAAGYRGIALTFRRDTSSRSASQSPADAPARQSGRGPLVASLRRSGRRLGVLVLATLVANLLALAGPVLVGRAVGIATTGGSSRSLLAVGLAVCAAVGIVASLRLRSTVHLQRDLDADLTPAFFRHVVGLPYHELEQRGAGDVLARMDSLALARLAVSGQVINTVLDCGVAVVATGALWLRSPVFATVVAIAIVVQITTLTLLARPIHEATMRVANAEGEVHGFTAAAIDGVATLKALGAEGGAARRFGELADRRRDAEVRRDRLSGRLDVALAVVHVAAPLAVLLAGLAGLAGAAPDPAGLVVAVGMAAVALSPAANVVTGVRGILSARVHVARLADLWAIDAQPAVQPVQLSGCVELRDAGLRYPGAATWALRHIDLRIEAGEHVAIVGRSGSGKSTLVKLLAGLLEPSEGHVAIGDADGRTTHDAAAARGSIGVVLQDVWMFAGTIAENVALDGDLDPAALHIALERAGIAAEVEALPRSTATRLGDGGAGLSGGQRQRLAVARALAREPRIVILDEATSHLDAATEAAVAASIAELGITRISVAHRMSTVRTADRIVVIANSTVAQVGTFDDLAASPGPFRDLLAATAPGDADDTRDHDFPLAV